MPVYTNTIKKLWYGSDDLVSPVIDYKITNENEKVVATFSEKMEVLYNKSETVYVISKTTLINMHDG